MTPQELKNSILQLAIQGKLVEQREEEGSAEELYQQIQDDKQKLIKEKIRKKQDIPTDIIEEDIPFDIPENWRWAYLDDLVIKDIRRGKSPKYNDNGSNTLVFAQKCNSKYNGIQLELARFLDEKTLSKYPEEENMCDGDVVINSTGGGTMGRVGYFSAKDNPLNKVIFPDSHVTTIRTSDKISSRYIYACLKYYQPYMETMGEGSTNQTELKPLVIKQLYIPLPPLAEQKRIVAKIEELLPYIDKYEKAWTKLEEFNKKFPDDMQKSILQLAIQGKLVEQREEGTAEELYKQIQDEKQKLIKEGKIKKQKALPDITEDEIPFEIPDSWKWCYVGEIFDHNTGKAMNSSAKKTNKSGSIRKFITTSNLYWNTFDFSNVKEMFFSDDELDRCTVKKGDLLMCEGGAYFGRTAIWNYDYDICFQNHVHRLRPISPLELKYFYYVFFLYKNAGMMSAQGTAMPGLSSKALHSMLIPVPPIEEQNRIVAKIEELLPICNKLK